MVEHLLPGNATALERALSETFDRSQFLGSRIELVRGFKYEPVIAVDFAPWIVAEYGLGPISAYFNDANMLIAAGIPWQRLRGTPLALGMALSWMDYTAIEIEDQHPNRRKWNRYQIGMGETPLAELPLLLDAEYLAGLSDPARSVFFRGWHGYDVRALEWSAGKWSYALYSDDSGVRVDGGTVKWSHGEDFTATVVAEDEDRIALGVDFEVGDELDWGEFPWNAPGLTWEGIADVGLFKAFLIARLPVYIAFYDGDGDVIGYRRPIAVRDVTSEHDSAPGAAFLSIECRTGFGDAEGATAVHVSLVFNAVPAEGVKPGKLWLSPAEIEFVDGYEPSEMTIGHVPVAFTFRRTVRQHLTITLEI